MTDDGESLDSETTEKLLNVAGSAGGTADVPADVSERLSAEYACAQTALLDEAKNRNLEFFEQEIEKLDRWADDLKEGVEREIRELEVEIRAVKKESRQSATLEQKLATQRQVKELEKKLKDKRKHRDEAQDEIETRKDTLIEEIEAQLQQRLDTKELFTIRWRVA
jgi:DNA repair exonuclease SbcCD ATPase subunit